MRLRNSAIATAIAVCALGYVYHSGADEMLQVKFDIGSNITETAKNSGAPRWSTRNIQGFVSYDLSNIPTDIPLFYQRPGYEVSAMPAYSFTMYADKEHNNNLAVEAATLLFDTNAYKSHASAKIFVEGLISQFQKGKWTRRIDDWCPAVTGRSSFLDEAGELDTSLACPLDPAYQLSLQDWIRMMYMGKNYEWLGDGVLARLEVRYSDDIRGITYSVSLAFDDFAAKTRQDEINHLRDLAEGDANGWKSTENYKKAIAENRLKMRILEEHARKRGDKVIQR
jgi:hypothetical protein